MNNIFSGLLNICVVIYLDDIFICSNNISKHHWHVKKVLKHLCKADLYTKAEKCKFYSKLVEYLEYILSISGLTMSDNKVKIIQHWPESRNIKNIQFFLDFANFYCWFIFNYSDIVIPLTCLTQKNVLWNFDLFYCNTFNSLKKTFTSTPILTHQIPNTQLIMKTDTLYYVLAVMLSIVNEENEVHPVAFCSHTFTIVELNYDIYDKELFATFKIQQYYLEGLAYFIDIVIDYKNLEYFFYY